MARRCWFAWTASLFASLSQLKTVRVERSGAKLREVETHGPPVLRPFDGLAPQSAAILGRSPRRAFGTTLRANGRESVVAQKSAYIRPRLKMPCGSIAALMRLWSCISGSGNGCQGESDRTGLRNSIA